MLREDNSGFVNFPLPNKMIDSTDGKTFVYLVAFDSEDVSNKAYELSNLRLIRPGSVVLDDISMRNETKINETRNKYLEYESIYFPNSDNNDEFMSLISMPMTTCICIGWSEYIYELKENRVTWCASFRDLTNEGRKLYYSIKKLHNNKEVRLLTFNNF